MSFLSRLFKPKTEAVEKAPHPELVEAVGLLLLASREKRDDSLRHSGRLGELLGLLWREERQAVQAVYNAFNSVERLDRAFVEKMGQRVRTLQRTPPSTPEGRYGTVVQALQAEIAELPADPVLASGDNRLFVNTLTLARILMPAELHSQICEFLVANHRARRNDSEDVAALPYQELVCENMYRFLASIAPEAKPVFWEMLRNEATSQEFWPALRRIRDSNAVPYLLDLLPTAEDEQGRSPMTIDGQKEVIQVLREIGDARAVPVLQAMEKRLLPEPDVDSGMLTTWDRTLSKAWRERNELARVAGQAARHILRTSGEPQARLLRPSERSAPSGDTLLRPFAPSRGMPPQEMLRPVEQIKKPERPKRTL